MCGFWAWLTDNDGPDNDTDCDDGFSASATAPAAPTDGGYGAGFDPFGGYCVTSSIGGVPTPGTGSCSLFSASSGNSGGSWWGYSSFGGGGSTPKSQRPSLFHSAGCTVAKPLTAAAKRLNGTIGIGAGGSAGIGFIAGVAASAGVQFVADSQGNVGVAFNVGGNPGYGVFGIGATGGVQGSYSTASSIYGLSGFSMGGGATAGPGGVDVTFGSSGVTATGTLGVGAGTKGAALSLNYTWVPAALSTNCGQ